MGERRQSMLTEDDLEKIKSAFKEQVTALFENIGYDISTPKARALIHADHTFVREWRTGSGKLKMGAFVVLVGALSSAALHAFWDGIKAMVKGG